MDSLSDEKKCAIKVCGLRLSSAGFVILLRSALLVRDCDCTGGGCCLGWLIFFIVLGTSAPGSACSHMSLARNFAC